MKIEFVDFYPRRIKGNKTFRGTCQIYIVDFDMDIRGIMVSKNGSTLRFYMPVGTGIDHETNERVRYPLISFTKKETMQEIFDFLGQIAQEKIWPVLQEEAKKMAKGVENKVAQA